MITKTQFVKLAEAFMAQLDYEEELSDTVQAVAKKYRRETDFLGLPSDSGVLLDGVSNILGDDFSYYCFDCNKSFDQFNEKITMADGSHPDVHSLEDLYDFAVKEGSIE